MSSQMHYGGRFQKFYPHAKERHKLEKAKPYLISIRQSPPFFIFIPAFKLNDFLHIDRNSLYLSLDLLL